MFSTAEEAALAYNKMSRKLYGEEGKLNVLKTRKSDMDDEQALVIPKKRGRKKKEDTGK
jgi:hypothetical protein